MKRARIALKVGIIALAGLASTAASVNTASYKIYYFDEWVYADPALNPWVGTALLNCDGLVVDIDGRVTGNEYQEFLTNC